VGIVREREGNSPFHYKLLQQRIFFPATSLIEKYFSPALKRVGTFFVIIYKTRKTLQLSCYLSCKKKLVEGLIKVEEKICYQTLRGFYTKKKF
jgi:hypothetical protein